LPSLCCNGTARSASYHRNHVIGRPGAFVEIAQDEQSFPRALLGKFLAEVTPRPAGGTVRA
jgi:hypothetical protein